VIARIFRWSTASPNFSVLAKADAHLLPRV